MEQFQESRIRVHAVPAGLSVSLATSREFGLRKINSLSNSQTNSLLIVINLISDAVEDGLTMLSIGYPNMEVFKLLKTIH